jgi:hypothetical protein
MKKKRNSAVSILLLITLINFGQSTPKYMNELYNSLFNSLDNGTFSKPKLVIVNDLNLSKKVIAEYVKDDKTIFIGLSFIALTRKFDSDSNNARAHVLSHELAHLFLNHGNSQMIGTSFASVVNNKELRNSKKNIEENIREFEADQWAYFYSYISGYKINNIAPRLLDTLYKVYHIPEELDGYPSLKERKQYAKYAKIKMQSMCEAFDFANTATMMGDYEMSEKIYSAIHDEGFQSREIKSNLGTVSFLKAIDLIDTSEFKYILPIQIDMNSRLRQNIVRSSSMDNEELITALDNAIRFYDGATRIDSKYKLGYFNLSMVHWLKDYILQEPKDDYKIYLAKAKDSSDSKLTTSELNNIKTFEAIINLCSKNQLQEKQGFNELTLLANNNFSLAKVNLNIINNNAIVFNPKIPQWILTIQSTILPSNFGKINILDSTFKRTYSLRCFEIKGNILSRRWKYINANGSPTSITDQFIFSDTKTITEKEKNELALNCEAIFENNNQTYLKFGNLIVNLNSKNNCSYQIIKSHK